jgi:8-oxo-dGTP pyrophosphatase MutT (NUDIX family)
VPLEKFASQRCNGRDPVAGLCIFDKNHRILLLKRQPHGSRPGEWEPPGGRTDETDPTILESAHRETKEETGLNIKPNAFICEVDFDGSKTYRKFNFATILNKEAPLVALREDEHCDAKWYTLNEIEESRLKMSMGQFATLSEAFEWVKYQAL